MGRLLGRLCLLVGMVFWNYIWTVRTDPGTVPKGWVCTSFLCSIISLRVCYRNQTSDQQKDTKSRSLLAHHGIAAPVSGTNPLDPTTVDNAKNASFGWVRPRPRSMLLGSCPSIVSYVLLGIARTIDERIGLYDSQLRCLHSSSLVGWRFQVSFLTDMIFSAVLNNPHYSLYHFYCLASNQTTIEGWEKDKVATLVRKGKIREANRFGSGAGHNECVALELASRWLMELVSGKNFIGTGRGWAIIVARAIAIMGGQALTPMSMRVGPMEDATDLVCALLIKKIWCNAVGWRRNNPETQFEWPPKDPNVYKDRNIASATALQKRLQGSPWTYGNEGFNPALRMRVANNHPPYHPSYQAEGPSDESIHPEIDAGRQFDHEYDSVSTSSSPSRASSEYDVDMSADRDVRMRRGSEGWEVRPMTNEEIVQRYARSRGLETITRPEPEPDEDEPEDEGEPLDHNSVGEGTGVPVSPPKCNVYVPEDPDSSEDEALGAHIVSRMHAILDRHTALLKGFGLVSVASRTCLSQKFNTMPVARESLSPPSSPRPSKRVKLNDDPETSLAAVPKIDDSWRIPVDYTNGIILAPMVLPTRLLSLKYGATLVWSPEIIDKAIIGSRRIVDERTGVITYMKPNSNNPIFTTHPVERTHLIFQIGSSDPDLAAQAAQVVIQDVAGIDLNCGCPKPFSVHAGMGAALLSTPDLLCGILSKLRSTIPPNVPLSAKIRLLADAEATRALVSRIWREGGISALTVHCRTREMRPITPAVTSRMREAVDQIAELEAEDKTGRRVAVIYNGDCPGALAAQEIKDRTGATSVMMARAAEANPSCFDPSRPAQDAELEIMPEYLRLVSFGREPKYCSFG
ncbi:tRNA-dihydrouridine synthase 2 [Rhizoctonia solani AG-1 IA]|uniref:tRNA-dihydrouridine synthase 2 n=1 Tax=Thanatephorus cucumeris (strain AG1-IA) TaxID=983506 RepID=L8WSP5_THACA|nr:tRNA-dihydrouridine synthase 2 [Rhizoctonia solani AG-1 IA]